MVILVGTGVSASYFVGASAGAAVGIAIGCDGFGPVMQALWEWDAQVEVDTGGFTGGKFSIGGLEMEITFTDWGGKCCSDVLVGATLPRLPFALTPALVGITTSEPMIQRSRDCGHLSCPFAVGFSVTGVYAVFDLVEGISNGRSTTVGVYGAIREAV